MKEFILKNQFWGMMLLGVGVAVWALCCWSKMVPTQHIAALFFIAITLHCVEEMKLPGGFVDMVVKFVGFPIMDMRFPKLLLTLFVVYLAFVPLFFPHVAWMGAAPLYLGIVEVVAHLLAAARMNERRVFYSPGMVTALVIMLPLTVWGFHTVISQHLLSGLDWLWAFLYLFIPLIITQRFVVKMSGMPYREFVGNAVKTLFGKKNTYPEK